MNRVDPITLTFEDGKTYTLEFNRKTVEAAERSGFSRISLSDNLMTMVPILFHFAFKMHHASISKEKTDKILFDDLQGLTDEEVDRLVDLFNAPYDTLTNEDGERKNSRVTVTM